MRYVIRLIGLVLAAAGSQESGRAQGFDHIGPDPSTTIGVPFSQASGDWDPFLPGQFLFQVHPYTPSTDEFTRELWSAVDAVASPFTDQNVPLSTWDQWRVCVWDSLAALQASPQAGNVLTATYSQPDLGDPINPWYVIPGTQRERFLVGFRLPFKELCAGEEYFVGFHVVLPAENAFYCGPPESTIDGGSSISVDQDNWAFIADGALAQHAGTLAYRLVAQSSPIGEPYCSNTVNSTGAAAYVVATGSASVGDNALELSASAVPDGFGIFFYGTTTSELPFGDGFLCLTPPVIRLAVQTAAGGTLSQAVDLTSPPEPAGQITAGSTWSFQGWFRDPAAGASGFNLSNGVTVLFAP